MITFSNHTDCLSLSSVFQGGLCEKLMARPGRLVGMGQVIYNMGDEARSIFFLRKGLIKVTALSEDGKEMILSIHKTGEMFGEFCLCGEERGEMAAAMEESELVEIRFDELVEHLQTDQAAMYNFLVSICQRLSRAYQTLSELSFDSLSQRLAKVLLRLADEMGRETSRGTELEHYITQEELAQMVSARREVVSSILGRLRKDGLVHYSRKGKLTVNRSALLSFVQSAEPVAGRRLSA